MQQFSPTHFTRWLVEILTGSHGHTLGLSGALPPTPHRHHLTRVPMSKRWSARDGGNKGTHCEECRVTAAAATALILSEESKLYCIIQIQFSVLLAFHYLRYHKLV